MTVLAVKQVDAFTSQPFTGNPAAVIPEAEGLTVVQMQSIAREMNCSETVFVVPPTDPSADLQIRWFTPTTEASLCGHATIACFHALWQDGRLGFGGERERTFQVQTRSGILPVRVEPRADAGPIVWFGLPTPDLRPCRMDREVLAELLGVHPGAFSTELPFAEFYSYAVIPFRSLDALRQLSPDAYGLSRLTRETGVEGYCTITLETVDPDSGVHIRFFAPAEGIAEDPVTGSAHGPLGVYLWRNGILRPDNGIIRHVGEQGDGMGHRGRARVQVTVDGEEVRQVEVGGEAVTVLEGSLHL